MNRDTRGDGERLLWPDLARGGCILLVVLLHADFGLAHIGESDPRLHLLNLLLVPLRLPLFFLVSGMLGASILARPARLALVHRVGRYCYLYILWWLLQRGFETRLVDGFGPPEMQEFFATPGSLWQLFTESEDDHWFFYALAVFFGLALASRRLPAAARMGLALGLAVPAAFMLGTAHGVPAFDWFYHLPWFMAGVTGSGWVRRMAPLLGRGVLLLPLGLSWVLASWLARRFDPLLGNLSMAAVSLLALPVGVGAAAWLAVHGGRWVAPMAAIGRNTMAIYALHPFVMQLLFILLKRPPGVPAAAWVVLAAAGTALLSLLLGRLVERIPGLFDLPSWPRLLRSRAAG